MERGRTYTFRKAWHSCRIRSNSIGLQNKNRTKCEVWTRVMGYHRPVTEFNPGKKSEYAEREVFTEDTAMKGLGRAEAV